MNSATLTRKSRTNFAWAFWGLPRKQRSALQALYAFCRTVDDAVDEAQSVGKAEEELDRWKGHLDRLSSPSVFDPAIVHELSVACENFPIDRGDLYWILEGVRMDLYHKRYSTFEDLTVYLDAVASAVGFASLAIFGADRKKTEKYAFATGRALQLTNILRDVATDARRGRIYLPTADIEQFGYRERDLQRSVYNEAFTRLMAFEVGRARAFYAEAESALSGPERKLIPAAEVMRKTYERLLERIERQKFNIFPNKIRVSPPRKVAIAFQVWTPHLFKI